MKGVKVITVGSGAQNVVNNKKAAKRFDVFAIDSVEGSGNDEAKGRQLAESYLERLEQWVGYTMETVFVISTLGGGTGTGGTPVVIKYLASKGVNVVAIVTMPMKFEGTLKYEKSLMVVKSSIKTCRMTIVINQDNYIKRLGDKTIVDFFKMIDEEIYNEINLLCPKKRWPLSWLF